MHKPINVFYQDKEKVLKSYIPLPSERSRYIKELNNIMKFIDSDKVDINNLKAKNISYYKGFFYVLNNEK